MTVLDMRPVCCWPWLPGDQALELVGRICRYCSAPIAAEAETKDRAVACLRCCVARRFVEPPVSEEEWERLHG